MRKQRKAILGRAMAQAVSRRHLTAEVTPRSVHMRFVVDKVLLRQVFSASSLTFSVIIIPLWLHTRILSGDQQLTRSWLQFRDIASSHRHE
jgi:hypothetical protein